MSPSKSTIIFGTTFLITSLAFSSQIAARLDVTTYGAEPDGETDSTEAFLRTWKDACGDKSGAVTVLVPDGTYLIKPVTFRGPCKSSIFFNITGTLVAPLSYKDLGNSGYWILFIKVSDISIYGGTLDARAAGFWACRQSGKSCPVGARSLTFNWANNVSISSLTSINSQVTHLVINRCKNVTVTNVNVIAPDESPNTDGIHVQMSNNVSISDSSMQTGDDCVSIGPGTYNLNMSNIRCGPGHGISIGSLGRDLNEDGVENVTLSNAIFTGSQNGVRIKSWAWPSTGFVRNVIFQNIVMKNAKNPIIIDQNYCPDNKGCPNQTSGVQISDVAYINIRGTSAKARAIILDCSPSSPCFGIHLEDIDLKYMDAAVFSSCKNIANVTGGVVQQNSCL
uniref:Polygalacturonase n=1 Tax=Kalanchoe fedtschenkoi TaxID=63787 RepID=A0A7N0TWU5_KALFE